MKFKRSVVTTSSIPNLSRSKAGPANNIAPEIIEHIITSVIAIIIGNPVSRLFPTAAATNAPI